MTPSAESKDANVKVEPIAALEIGTSRTVLAVGEPLGGNRVRLTAKCAIPSSGVRKSRIMDVQQAAYSADAVRKRLAETDYTIQEVYLAVSDPDIALGHVTSEWKLDTGVVREEDVAGLQDNWQKSASDPADLTLLDYNVLGYSLDDMDGVNSPVGMSGTLLRQHVLEILGPSARLKDAKSAAARAKISVLESYFAGTCAARAVLTPADMKDGALVIDLGGGTTAYAAAADGRFIHAGALGVGGDHVTNDLRQAFGLTLAQAEEIKKSQSSALLDPNAVGRLEIPARTPGLAAQTISRRSLNVVVNARLAENFSLILEDLDRANVLHRLNAGIILTGGGAALAHVADLAQSIFGRPVRIGTLIPEIEGLADEPHPESWAVAAGTIYTALLNSGLPDDAAQPSFGGLIGKIFGK